jgi:luciferase family oxidoreductase group 1
LTTFAWQRDRPRAAPDDFPQQLSELLAYLDGSLPEDHPFARLQSVLPGRPAVPEPWLLGSSTQSAIWAAQLALPYAFADFINSAGAEIASVYRRRFASEHPDTPSRTAVAAWVVCADTDEEAEYLAASSRMTLRLLRRGELIPVPPPERAIEFLRSEGAPDSGPLPGRRAIIGAPAKVAAELDALAQEYGAEEVIVVTITYDHQARRHSYELIAEAVGLLTDAPPGALCEQ